MNLTGWFKRWRRGKGFGIHSPFAYYFVTRVLRERLPYYAYPEIERIASRDGIPADELKLLFRVCCHFSPSTVTLPAGTPAGVARTLKLADSRVKITQSATKFQYYNDADVAESDFRRLTCAVLEDEGVIMLRRPSPWMCAIRDEMQRGMTFTDGSSLIIVIRHDLPRQDFNIGFRP